MSKPIFSAHCFNENVSQVAGQEETEKREDEECKSRNINWKNTEKQENNKVKRLYMIALCTLHVPTCSVR